MNTIEKWCVVNPINCNIQDNVPPKLINQFLRARDIDALERSLKLFNPYETDRESLDQHYYRMIYDLHLRPTHNHYLEFLRYKVCNHPPIETLNVDVAVSLPFEVPSDDHTDSALHQLYERNKPLKIITWPEMADHIDCRMTFTGYIDLAYWLQQKIVPDSIWLPHRKPYWFDGETGNAFHGDVPYSRDLVFSAGIHIQPRNKENYLDISNVFELSDKQYETELNFSASVQRQQMFLKEVT